MTWNQIHLRKRNNNKERPVLLLLFNNVGDQADGLNCLAKTHFICQDAIQIVVVQRHHPLQAFELKEIGQISNTKQEQ